MRLADDYRLPDRRHADAILDKLNYGSARELIANKWRLSLPEKFKGYSGHEKTLFPEGLTMKQMAQAECQMVVDAETQLWWRCYTVRNREGKPHVAPLHMASFCERLAIDLAPYQDVHVYSCRHPALPLSLVRIMLFITTRVRSRARGIILAIPTNSAHIFVTSAKQVPSGLTKTVIQSISRCLPQNSADVINVVPEEQVSEMDSLESMTVHFANSRFAQAMGAYTAYADGKVDPVPLATRPDHESNRLDLGEANAQLKQLSALERANNLRYTGTADGVINSEIPFEMTGDQLQKRRLLNLDTKRERYDSLAPVQRVQFVMDDAINSKPSGIVMTFTGSDVFGGLHELADDPDLGVFDSKHVPDFLTGVEGDHGGHIKNGRLKLQK
ncbi:hypothetical protein DIURU_003257 [Diutina rugosa]|uniref:Uncharacterized protein n=1 Tax=Diutina rugosa TaxID=5481 RepID=A0A642ULH0_DIURU|nr:uncharacterized protein DIURU_003257 [Diutina rugosa]KAA8901405.1 hypothetical protein DIURU_003257 [Diutina rugosa]